MAVACFLFLIFFYLRETWRITRQSAVSDGGSDKWDPVFKTTLTQTRRPAGAQPVCRYRIRRLALRRTYIKLFTRIQIAMVYASMHAFPQPLIYVCCGPCMVIFLPPCMPPYPSYLYINILFFHLIFITPICI